MNGDTIRLVAFLFLCLFSFYGGAFLYFLVRYRFVKKRPWLESTGFSLIWMLAYAFIATIVADIGVAGLKSYSYINTGIMVVIVALPYIAAVRLFIKSRHV